MTAEAKHSHDKKPMMLVVENRFCEKIRVVKIKVLTITNHTYVGDFKFLEIKRRASDALNDEKTFVSLINVSVDGHHDLLPYMAINKNHIVTVEEL